MKCWRYPSTSRGPRPSPGATIDTLEIEVEDWWGNTETISVDLIDTFPHGLGGLGEGRTGRVTLIPEHGGHIYSIRILNLRDGGGGGQINEYAIDNLSVGGGVPSGGELGVVDYEGQPVLGLWKQCPEKHRDFRLLRQCVQRHPGADELFGSLVKQQSGDVSADSRWSTFPSRSWATQYEAVRWEIDTNTALSGEYNGVFTVTNNTDPNDPDDTITVNFLRVYDAPSLTDNGGTTLTAPGGQATLSNAAASGHPGALRASVKVTQVVQSNPRFSVSGINVGSEVNPGNTLTGTVSYNSAGAPSGPQTGQMRVKIGDVRRPQTFLNRKTPVADRIWPLTFNVPAVPEVTPSVTTGQQLAEAGLAISGEELRRGGHRRGVLIRSVRGPGIRNQSTGTESKRSGPSGWSRFRSLTGTLRAATCLRRTSHRDMPSRI